METAWRRLCRHTIPLVAVVAMVIQLADPAAAHADGDPTEKWKAAVKTVPGAGYTRDARTYIRGAATALTTYFSDEQRATLLNPVFADLENRYVDGVRLRTKLDGIDAFEHLNQLISRVLEELRCQPGLPPERVDAYIAALVGLVTGGRLIADGAIGAPS